MDDRQQRLVTDLLRGVSRAFYLTLRVMPAGVREPVGLAYLLARAADTIADTALVPAEERLERLLAFRNRIGGGSTDASFEELARFDGDAAHLDEHRLLESLPQVLAMLETLPESDGVRVRSIVSTLTVGMEYDLKNYPAESSGEIGAVRDLAELDRYTYLVAGCVGEFWTEVSMAHTPALRGWHAEHMSRLGVRFGKALQLTNVLRDVPRDLRIGRCYLPRDELSLAGLTPEDLLRTSSAGKARPILVRRIRTALEHFAAAEEYVLRIPRRCYRLRLAALWPMLIGLATLAILARNEAWLDPARPSKVSRPFVYATLAFSLKAEPSNAILHEWIAALRRRVEGGLDS